MNRLSNKVYGDPELSSLAASLPEVALSSKACNTSKKYQRSYNSWSKWARQHGLVVFPANDVDFSLYLVSLIQSCNSPSTVDEAFYGMKWANDLAGNLNNPCSSFLVKSVREAAHRILGHRVSRKEPVTPEILFKLVNVFGNTDVNLFNLRNITMCLLAYAGFLRFSELINIKRSDILFKTDHIALFIDHSKTDIYRDGSWCLIAKTGNVTCPVNMLLRYLTMANIDENSNDFIFRSVTFFKSSNCYKLRGTSPLSYTRARELILDMFEHIGLDKSKFGLHSLRSGGASAAANAGVSDRLFKRHGRWKSEKAKDSYVKDDIDKRLLVSKCLGL